MAYHNLPSAAHGDTLPVVKAVEKMQGKGEARHSIGAEIQTLLPFDNCAAVSVIIEGFDLKRLPPAEEVTAHNMKLDFIMGRFSGLKVEFAGGDYGAVNYRATATGVEFLNLTTAPSGGAAASK